MKSLFIIESTEPLQPLVQEKTLGDASNSSTLLSTSQNTYCAAGSSSEIPSGCNWLNPSPSILQALFGLVLASVLARSFARREASLLARSLSRWRCQAVSKMLPSADSLSWILEEMMVLVFYPTKHGRFRHMFRLKQGAGHLRDSRLSSPLKHFIGEN